MSDNTCTKMLHCEAAGCLLCQVQHFLQHDTLEWVIDFINKDKERNAEMLWFMWVFMKIPAVT